MNSGFYDSVCSELKVIFDQSSLPELKKDLHVSQKYGSVRGEILSIRKILDAHFHLHFSKYDWKDKLLIDIDEWDKIFEKQISVTTLFCYWYMWKENVVTIFKGIESYFRPNSYHNEEEPNKHQQHVNFSLNYFGVRECYVNGSIAYLLIDKDAGWIRKYGQKGLHKDGKHVTIDRKELALAIMSYWQSELLSMGIKVLETLEGLHTFISNGSVCHQSISLLYMFEVSKFLLDCQYLSVKNTDTKKLKRFLGISFTYFDLVFPLDWRNVVSEDLVSLRGIHLERRLLEEIILHYVDTKEDLTNWTIGRVIMLCLGPRLPIAHYEHIIKKLQRNPQWKLCVEIIRKDGLKYMYTATAVQRCLEDTFTTNWRCANYVSPHSFVYLLDRFFLMLSFSSEVVYTTKSSFVGLLPRIHSGGTSTLSSGPYFCNVRFVVATIQEILDNREDTISWIQRLKIDRSYYPLLVLKLVTLLSLICLKVDYAELLLDLLSGRNNISCLLPKKFVGDLLRKREDKKLNLNVEVVAEAFLSINDPLLIVSSINVTPKIAVHCAIYVDLRKSKDEIVSLLFPRKNKHTVRTHAGATPEVLSLNTLPGANINVNCVELQKNWKVLDKISEAINGKKGVALNKLSHAAIIKDELDKNRDTLLTALADQNLCYGVQDAIDNLKLLSFAFDPSRLEVGHSVLLDSVEFSVKMLQSIRPTLDDFLSNFGLSHESKVGKMPVSERSCTTEVEKTCNEDSHVEVVLENRSGGGNTLLAKNKERKGNNKGKKSKKSKGKKK